MIYRHRKHRLPKGALLGHCFGAATAVPYSLHGCFHGVLRESRVLFSKVGEGEPGDGAEQCQEPGGGGGAELAPLCRAVRPYGLASRLIVFN